jgi:hypothetical protein
MIEAEFLIAWIEGRFGVKWMKAMKSHPWLESQNNAFMRAAKPYGFGMVLAMNKTAAIWTVAGTVAREYAPGSGSVSAAARALGVSSVDLRRMVASQPVLADAIYDGTERAIDEAVQGHCQGK